MAFISPLPNANRGGLSFRIMKRNGCEKTPELTPVNIQELACLPVAMPAAIMWSAAAQKSGLPGAAKPPGSGAMLKALMHVGNMTSHEHCSASVLPDGAFAGGESSASA